MQQTQDTKPHRPATNGRSRQKSQEKPLFFNRELSWLNFNARVLEEAMNTAHPLLERLKFLCIFSNNLDEFFMIHVPGMRDRTDEDTEVTMSGSEIRSRLKAIQSKLIPMLDEHARCFQELLPLIAKHGVRLLSYNELTDIQKERLTTYFENEVFPVLTPLAVDPGHPFPYISNLSLSLAVVVFDPVTEKEHFARVKVPSRPVLPRLVPVAGEKWQFVLLEEIITAHLHRLFTGMEIRAAYPFRVTRNADLEIADQVNTDLLEMIEEQLSQRRFGEVERLEVVATMPENLRKTLTEELEQVTDEEVYEITGPLNLADFFTLASLDIPELRDNPFTPGIPVHLRGATDMFAAIREGDILLHHPYQSFGCVTDFLRLAANDPQVLTIKHTLYRTSGDSPILQALTDAADNGKQVACLVELKARFDEANNITWARQLEKSGVHVVYGLLGLKTHCKITLVVRREEDGLRRYLHVGTGNYNPRTAAVYTDIGLLTCSTEFGADATDLFNFLTGYSRLRTFRKFLVAPINLREQLLSMIEREKTLQGEGKSARIIAKMNALVDPALMKALYSASQAGVQIDLIIRGMCCLRPGVPGLSENIRVISIVGRFLEHSRIFYFGNGGEEEIYIGSADWMSRNLDRRVEVVAPVEDPELRRILHNEVLQLLLADNTQTWELRPEGNYVRRKPASEESRVNAQVQLLHTLAQ